jgi:hypothetical protein
VYNEYREIYECRACKQDADIGVVDSCKSAIVLQEEIAAANIRLRLGLKPREYEAGLADDTDKAADE